MSLRCHDGVCTRSSNDLTTGVPSNIVQLEAEILHKQGGRTMESLFADSSYHAYWTTNRITAEHSLAVVWNEYVYYPAPRFPTLPTIPSIIIAPTGYGYSLRFWHPAHTGETTFVYFGVLIGGMVEHIVRPDIFALANVTIENRHVLYPGYIIRWLERQADGTILSHTLGRGVGHFARMNEYYGSMMFTQLDENIKAHLPRRER